MTPIRLSTFRNNFRCCRTAGMLVWLASLGVGSAGAQHLDLVSKQSVLPETFALANVITAEPANTAGATELNSAVADNTATATATSAALKESSSTTSGNSEAGTLPETPSAILALRAPGAAAPIVAEAQFNTLNPKDAPKTADGRPIAPRYTKYIPPDWGYQPVHGREKLILGARDLYSPSNIAAIFISAGYSHLVDGQPNYGVNREAFAKRLGATAIRETAEGIFTDGVFAVMFHQDPRYFAEGPKYSVMHRALYAATRPIIVRTTNGTGNTVNSSLLAGYAAATLLNNAYYPQINRNVKDNLSSYGGSIGGAALGFVVSEFTDDALYLLHLKHKP